MKRGKKGEWEENDDDGEGGRWQKGKEGDGDESSKKKDVIIRMMKMITKGTKDDNQKWLIESS